jgi:hypothetical protein
MITKICIVCNWSYITLVNKIDENPITRCKCRMMAQGTLADNGIKAYLLRYVYLTSELFWYINSKLFSKTTINWLMNIRPRLGLWKTE